jgi:restriction system protein
MNATPDLPDYQTLMLPLLRIAAERETSLRLAVDRLADELALTAAQRAGAVPSRRFPVLQHRAHWARTHMLRAGLIERRPRGAFRATARGRALLADMPDRHDLGATAIIPELASARPRAGKARAAKAPAAQAPAPVPPPPAPAPPAQRLAAAADELDAALRRDLLDRISAIDDTARRSALFEQLVVDLLMAMGYGGSRREAAIRLGRSNDGGVDAVILLDPLGLDRLYVQAKCYAPDRAVDIASVRDFAGSLDDKKTARGVLITTSRFSRAATEFVCGIHRPLVLIDGTELARLMIAHGIGVRAERIIAVKAVEEGYFEPDCRRPPPIGVEGKA